MSNVWVNQKVKSNKRKYRQRKKKSSSVVHNQVNTTQKSAQQHNVVSLLETFATIAKKVDLVNLRNQITEINQICEQVNGIMQHLGQMNRPPQPPYNALPTMRGNRTHR